MTFVGMHQIYFAAPVCNMQAKQHMYILFYDLATFFICILFPEVQNTME